MAKKVLVIMATMVVLPPLCLALNQSSLFFLTLGIDMGVVGMFVYGLYNIYKLSKMVSQLENAAEAGIKAMEKAGMTGEKTKKSSKKRS